MTTHDYTKRGWGHDLVIMEIIDKGQTIETMGWGFGLKQGDYLLLETNNGATTRYQIAVIDYYGNPRDMWKASLTFAPRLT